MAQFSFNHAEFHHFLATFSEFAATALAFISFHGWWQCHVRLTVLCDFKLTYVWHKTTHLTTPHVRWYLLFPCHVVCKKCWVGIYDNTLSHFYSFLRFATILTFYLSVAYITTFHVTDQARSGTLEMDFSICTSKPLKNFKILHPFIWLVEWMVMIDFIDDWESVWGKQQNVLLLVI